MFPERQKKKNDYADICLICAQSDFLRGLPSSLFCSAILRPPASVSTTHKENADLHNLKKCETTAFSNRNALLLFAFTKSAQNESFEVLKIQQELGILIS